MGKNQDTQMRGSLVSTADVTAEEPWALQRSLTLYPAQMGRARGRTDLWLPVWKEWLAGNREAVWTRGKEEVRGGHRGGGGSEVQGAPEEGARGQPGSKRTKNMLNGGYRVHGCEN